MDRVKVVIINDQKAVKIPTGIRILLRRCCNAVIKLEQLTGEYEVNITFVDNEKIRELIQDGEATSMAMAMGLIKVINNPLNCE